MSRPRLSMKFVWDALACIGIGCLVATGVIVVHMIVVERRERR